MVHGDIWRFGDEEEPDLRCLGKPLGKTVVGGDLH